MSIPDIIDWFPFPEWRTKKRTKYRGYQNAGHNEKIAKSRHKKNKAARKARRKNR